MEKRAVVAFSGDITAASFACATARRRTEDLRLQHVPTMEDDNLDICIAHLRDVLADRFQNVSPSLKAAVFCGPFGFGKRQLLQHILSLYPDHFCAPTVYTTNGSMKCDNFTVVEEKFIDNLEKTGMLAFKQTESGKLYAVSKEDIYRCVLWCIPQDMAAIGHVACPDYGVTRRRFRTP